MYYDPDPILTQQQIIVISAFLAPIAIWLVRFAIRFIFDKRE